MSLSSLLKSCRNKYRKVLRYFFRLYRYHRLTNKDFSIISQDCVGGIIYHDLFQRFDSPTINLWFCAADFLKFCRNFEFYISQELTECTSSGMNYPAATLGNDEDKITLYLIHYDTFEQAKQKWDERRKRLHMDNLFFIMNDREGCNEHIAREFDALPLKHKALITFRGFDGVKCAVKFSGKYVKKKGKLPIVLDYTSQFSARRIIDDWDYVAFLNGQQKEDRG